MISDEKPADSGGQEKDDAPVDRPPSQPFLTPGRPRFPHPELIPGHIVENTEE